MRAHRRQTTRREDGNQSLLDTDEAVDYHTSLGVVGENRESEVVQSLLERDVVDVPVALRVHQKLDFRSDFHGVTVQEKRVAVGRQGLSSECFCGIEGQKGNRRGCRSRFLLSGLALRVCAFSFLRLDRSSGRYSKRGGRARAAPECTAPRGDCEKWPLRPKSIHSWYSLFFRCGGEVGNKLK